MDRVPRKANSNAQALIPCRSVAVVHTFLGGIMIRRLLVVGVCCVALSAVLAAQTKTVPRPPAQPAGQQPPGESAAPDGYQPVPQWLGQTRAAVPAKVETFAVETFAQGVNGAAFQFLPDGRILLAEKNGRIRIVGKDGKLSEPL